MVPRICCLIILALEIRGLFLSIGDRRWKVFAYYTQLSNISTALSALLVILFGETAVTVPVRYLSSCMLAMTFFVTTCVLIPMGGDPRLLLLSGNGLYHHLIIPVLSVASYLLFEAHVTRVRTILLPTALTLLYGLVMLRLNAQGLFDGPYPFFRVKSQSAAATVLWMSALTAAIGLISLLIFLPGS